MKFNTYIEQVDHIIHEACIDGQVNTGMEAGEMFWAFIFEHLRTGERYTGFASYYDSDYFGMPLITVGLASTTQCKVSANMRLPFFRANQILVGCSFDLANLEESNDQGISLVCHFPACDIATSIFKAQLNHLVDQLNSVMPRKIVNEFFVMENHASCQTRQFDTQETGPYMTHLN